MKFFKLIISAVIFLSVACQQSSKSTTTGNPFVSFSVTGSSSVATVVQIWHGFLSLLIPTASALPAPGTMMDSAGNTVTITNLWTTVGEIEFKYDETAGGGEVDGSDVDFAGPYTVDMLSSHPSAIGAGIISTDQMRRIKVKLIRTNPLPFGAPANLNNNSFYLTGTVNGFTISFTTQDESVLEISGPNLVTALSDSSLVLQLRTANLIKRINFSSITSNTAISESNRVNAANPCPNIDASANDLYTCIRKGIETESTLGRDDNGDFEIESTEESFD